MQNVQNVQRGPKCRKTEDQNHQLTVISQGGEIDAQTGSEIT